MKTFSPLLLSLFLGSACSGAAGDAAEADGDPKDPTPGEAGGMDDPGAEPSSPAEITRLARLSHRQYENTVSDLFGIEDGSANLLAPDATNGFAFDTSINLRVDARLGPQYRTSAERLADLSVSDVDVFDTIVTCNAASAGCAAEFLDRFLERAFRRPATDEEIDRFDALFRQGAELVGSGDAFRDGVRLVVEAALQSPQFLYRSELSSEAGEEGGIPLYGYEVASKLSYLIFDSMPDEELFSLARENRLSTKADVDAAAERLLASDKALPKLSSFHEQAWAFARFSSISPDRDAYPTAPEDMPERAGAASRAFVRNVISSGGGLSEFLTAPYAYADSRLLPLYGETGGGELAQFDLDPDLRQGLFMQVGFLSSHAYSVKTDPIHRGLFIQRSLLCRDIPDPPPGASTEDPPTATEPTKTTREEVELLTGQPACAGCHAQINPPGFAFEAFDAVGQLRTDENGAALDTRGTLVLDGEEVQFDGAIELVSALAASQDAQSCYAERWLQFAHGRKLFSEDELTKLALSEAPLSVKQMVKTLASSPEFLTRASKGISQ